MRPLAALVAIGLLLMPVAGITAAPAAAITPDIQKLPLTLYLEMLPDPQGQFSIKQAQASDAWQPLPGGDEVYNAGFDTQTYWYRLQLHSDGDIPAGQVRYLEIAYPLLDYVDLYVLRSDGSREVLLSGDQRPFSERPIQHRNLVFPIRLQPADTTSLYLRVQTESTHTLPMTLWSDGAFIHKANNELAILGLYYGVMLIMILYNAFIWLSVRESSHLSYIAFILAGGVLLPATINGLGAEYLWGFYPRWTNISVLIATGLAVITGLQFVQSTLQARQRDPLFYWLLNLGILLGAVEILVVSFVDYAIGIRVAMMLGLLASVIVVSYALRSMLRGQRAATFFVLGWAAFLVGIALKVLQGHGVLPTNLLTQYAMQVGMVMQVTLLSLALADRINTERDGRLLAQDEAIKAREEAIQSLNQYQQIVDHVLEGVCQIDSEGQVIRANPALAKIFGYESPEAFMEAIDDYRVQMFANYEDVQAVGRQLRRDGFVQGYQAMMKRADGSEFWGEINLRSVLDEEGNIQHIDSMIADVQERVERENLAREREKAEASMLAKGEFLARMSHEIRTPMNAIVGFVDLALRSRSEHKRIDYLGQIRMASHSLLAIINDILDFSKIEAGKMQLESRPFRLHSIFEKLGDMFARSAAEKGIELVISVNDDVPPMLVGDPLRLEQVLVNIIGNAIKFTETGEVEVQAELVSQNGLQAELKITVRDTGIGLNEEQQGRLFKSFSQADESITRKYGGSGLGLSIGRQLVEMMGGTIGLFSEPDQGSRFWVHLPLSIAEETARGVSRKLPSELLGRRVLLVDDNATARRVYEHMLSAMGLTVEVATNGNEALSAVENSDIALVLLDANMPRPDGIETLMKIREIPQGSVLPVVLMAEYGCEEAIEQRPDVQYEACLTKPLKAGNVFAAVHEALQGWHSESFASLPEAGSLPEAEALEGLSLLLVEDNPLNQDLATELLTSLGMRVQVAQNGWESVEAVKRCDYDAVLMDVQMPVMDGYQATHKIRGDLGKQDLPIIGMSANTDARDRALGMEAGMNAYITKPIDLQELLYVLKQQVSANNESPEGVSGLEEQALRGVSDKSA